MKHCEDLRFQHLWEYCATQDPMSIHPPGARQRRCVNCGKRETESVQTEVLSWHINYSGNGACDRVGFRHRWFDGRPPHIRICANCGLSMEQRLIRPELHIWREVGPT